MILLEVWEAVWSCVSRLYNKGLNTQSWGDPVFTVMELDVFFSIYTVGYFCVAGLCFFGTGMMVAFLRHTHLAVRGVKVQYRMRDIIGPCGTFSTPAVYSCKVCPQG